MPDHLTQARSRLAELSTEMGKAADRAGQMDADDVRAKFGDVADALSVIDGFLREAQNDADENEYEVRVRERAIVEDEY